MLDLVGLDSRSALAKAIEHFPDLEQNVHIFSTYLYSKLSAKKSVSPCASHLRSVRWSVGLVLVLIVARKAKDGDPWEAVSRWTRKFDLFEKKYLIVPINEEWVKAEFGVCALRVSTILIPVLFV
jgi:Ulp1 family protease